MVVNTVKYVQIVINNKSRQTDRLYTYGCEDDSVCVGNRVIVPFGKGNRRTEGYVFYIEEDTEIEKEHLKSVIEVLHDDIGLNEESVWLCEWMKKEYFCKYIDAIQCFIPAGASIQKQQYVELLNNYMDFDAESIEYQIIQALKDKKKISLKKLNDMFENAEGRIKYLKNKGIVKISEVMKSKVRSTFKKYVRIKGEDKVNEYLQNKKNAPKQIKALNTLLEKGEISWELLKNEYAIEWSTVRSLSEKGLVEISQVEHRRIPCQDIEEEVSQDIQLTQEQTIAIDEIESYILKDAHRTCLIHGVTGSGKTEIYMQLIQKVLRSHKTAILLVPEISLTLQMIERFKGRFGEGSIAVLHSKLSIGERYDEWLRIKRGQVKIVIGARSSLFAPLSNIGIIILDEEHESSYKSDYTPKYDAVALAKKRAEINQSVLVLGSATPTVVSYCRSELGEYSRIELTKRYNDNLMPAVEIIDMREELQSGNKSIFSRMLYKEIEDSLKDQKQVILFLNRRGYASFISCRNCGYVLKCPKCGISLTYHANRKRAVCHYCGIEKKVPVICPECSSKYIKYFGVGTEQIEEIVKTTFPNHSCARLDLDTTKAKGSTQKILKDFKNRKTDILIGTQIVAKGLDFPNVRLVGILAADISLNIADYRASERTFQLITQAAGRAGRGDEQGKVIVQTYKPEHYAVTAACVHNYETFYRNEIIMRKQLEYPPYSDIIQIIVAGVAESDTCQLSRKVCEVLTKKIGDGAKQRILGPHLAPRQKINGKYRFQILIKCKPVDQIRYRGIINSIKNSFTKLEPKGYSLMIDFNPYSFM